MAESSVPNAVTDEDYLRRKRFLVEKVREVLVLIEKDVFDCREWFFVGTVPDRGYIKLCPRFASFELIGILEDAKREMMKRQDEGFSRTRHESAIETIEQELGPIKAGPYKEG